jgi:hypothetical protein
MIIQFFVLALLFYGYWLYRHKAFHRHGMVMASALFVHLASVIAVMLPSFAFAILPAYIAVNPLIQHLYLALSTASWAWW